MLILIDTNVLLDVIARREPYVIFSEKVIDLCRQEIINGAIAGHSVLNAMYVLRKNFTLTERKEIFLSLCEFLYVESVDFGKIIQALKDDDFSDFEDCLQMQCALSLRADYIVTRNVKDFAASEIPAVTPEEFLKILEKQECLPTD
ncbi:MAG: PIN domain-containing protein [Selenomonadaceae bacterium]|nr:PIN domain-containing protein [Selenomonadaceae bacterium]